MDGTDDRRAVGRRKRGAERPGAREARHRSTMPRAGFATDIDLDDLSEFDQGEHFDTGPGDIELAPADPGTPFGTVLLSGAFRLRMAGVRDAEVERLADADRIADLPALREALTDAHEAARLQPSVLIRLGDENAIASSPEQLEQYRAIGKICQGLQLALSGAGWPVGSNPLTADLLAALERYREWMLALKFVVIKPKRGKKGDREARAATMVLAGYWPSLTGKKATAYEVKSKEERDTPFYGFLTEALPLLDLELPKVRTVEEWLGHPGNSGRCRPK